MTNEKQLNELFKYIESNFHVYVTQLDKTKIKRIFGGVLTEDIMNDTLHEVKAEPELNPIERAYNEGKKIRHKNWLNGDWIKKHKETKTIDNYGNINSVFPFAFIQYPEKWEIYEPELAPTEPSSQVILDNSFDRERFERMFCAVVASNRSDNEFIETEVILEQLDAYYASKEGGNNG